MVKSDVGYNPLHHPSIYYEFQDFFRRSLDLLMGGLQGVMGEQKVRAGEKMKILQGQAWALSLYL